MTRPDTLDSHSNLALLDCGATDCFLDWKYVKRHQLPTTRLNRAIPIYNVDGSGNANGSITHKCEMNVQHKDHLEKIWFYITKIGNKEIILGHSWLKKHNPSIDWVTSEITFNRCPSECGRATPEKEENETKFVYHTQFSEHIMKFYHPELGIWDDVEVMPELRIYATRNISAEIEIELLKDKEPITFETAVPTQYHMYKRVFEDAGFQALPKRKPWDHAIDLKPDATPQKLTKAYPISPLEDKAMKEFIEENLTNGRIRPSQSPWASGFFFVKKKDGKLRPTQDYRALNSATVKNAYPLPLISDLFRQLRGAKYFSKMDVRWGFNNIRIKEGDEQKAAFLTPYGLFEPTVMFFGLCNSPATFQALMNNLLRDLIRKGLVMVYLDDILVYTKTLAEHRIIVKQVLQILQDNDLFLKPEKCTFEQTEVEYLGMIIGNGEIKMDPKKVNAITKWPTPNTVKDIQQFLGFCNFYRNFIQDFAKIARPMWNLTQKEKPWSWSANEEKAFTTIKDKLTSQPVLCMPTDTDPYKVECDASDYATGAVLSQKQNEEWRPIAFFSKALTAAERNYEIHDRELLAIVRALEEWRHYLQGNTNKIEVITDHKNLEYFLTAKKLNRRQARWSGLLADYDYILRHQAGKTMGKPDALSRRPDHLVGTENDNTNVTLISAEHIGSITIETTGDQIVTKIKSRKQAPINPRDKANWKQEDGITFREGLIVVNDKDLQLEIIQQTHDTPIGGHPGQAKTRELITRNYWWSGLTTYVNKYVDGCRKCQQNKIFPQKPQGELYPNAIPSKPFENVTMDFIVKLPPSQGFDSLLAITCRLTKRVYFIPCNETVDSEGTARLYKDNVWRHEGFPKIVISDRGPQFASKFTAYLCKILGIKQNISSAYHPQTDGQTERTNQEIETYLRIFVNWHQNDWSTWIPIAEFAYNNRIHSAIGHSPFYATKGYHVNTGITPSKSTQPIGKEEKRAELFAEHMANIHQETQSAMKKANEEMKMYYDRTHKPEEYEIGDQVWLDMKDINTGRPKKKLDILREGPFKITEKISRTSYRLELPPSWKITNSFHVSKLRRAKPDEFQRKLPRVTLHVRGDNWNATEITKAKLENGRLEYFTLWTLPDGRTHELWELSSRMENDAPNLIKEFYRKHPQAPRHILGVTLEQGKFTTGIDHSLPSEQELLHLARKNGFTTNTNKFSSQRTPPPPSVNNELPPQEIKISFLSPHLQKVSKPVTPITNPSDPTTPQPPTT